MSSGKNVTIGGKRLGSGAGTEVHLHGWNRSTHNLSHTWKSSMGVGLLTPVWTTIGLNGDTFDIDLEAMAKTVPLNGALFGSYKLQIDVFEAPIRLYHGALHNNHLGTGMKISEVKFPKYIFKGMTGRKAHNELPYEQRQVHPNSLLAHLGFNGAGVNFQEDFIQAEREIFGVPILAYYDIFKNYYANKQEKLCHMIGAEEEIYENLPDGDITSIWSRPYMIDGNKGQVGKWQYMASSTNQETFTLEYAFQGSQFTGQYSGCYKIVGWGLTGENVEVVDARTGMFVPLSSMGVVQVFPTHIEWYPDISFAKVQGTIGQIIRSTGNMGHYHLRPRIWSFDLSDLDKMRERCLNIRLGEQKYLNRDFIDLEPFNYICGTWGGSKDNFFMADCGGLMIKTYQSDIFNTWVQTDWIDDPVSGISAVTAVDTTSGSFTMDSLNLAKKVYDMLNRIAVSGGTYEDWQEAVYGGNAVRKVESPMYCGGYSSEIVFDQIVANTMSADGTPQGTLSGMGVSRYEKNGHCVIQIKEPSIIMIIASITPRIDYTAQNQWYMTDLSDMDDLHKPSLDGIGFEDLIEERACWLGSNVNSAGQYDPNHRNSVGKIPAWLNYMTAVDEAHGDFANKNKLGWMLNLRTFDLDENEALQEGRLTDFSTYIDPKKYNSAFSDTSLVAQNFWVQVGIHCTARRVMSAKVIPNL